MAISESPAGAQSRYQALAGRTAGQPNLIFASHANTQILRQEGFSDSTPTPWATGQPVGALGGDGHIRQFGYFSDGMIHEFQSTPDLPAFLSTLPAPANDIQGMAFDGVNLYVSTASGDLHTLDPNSGNVLRTVSVGTGGDQQEDCAREASDQC